MFPVGQTASCSSMTDQVLLLWIALFVPAPAVEENQAVGRPTWQSSTKYPDWRAVDGNTNTHLLRGKSCSETWGGQSGPHWWMVDLQRDVRISRVVLFNRRECCSYRLQQFHLQLHQMNPQISGNLTMVTSVYQHTKLPAGPTTFTFDPACTARWLMIIKPQITEALTLCEVQVFGTPLTTGVRPNNCLFNSVVLSLLPSLTTHAPLSVGDARPTLCASKCLFHDQCVGFYYPPAVDGPPPCTLVVSRYPLASTGTWQQGPITYLETSC